MINKILFTFLSRLLIALLSLVISVLVSNFLGAEGRGSQAIFLASISFVLHVSGVFGSESIAILHAKNQRYDYLWISYLWAGLLLLIASLMVFLFFQTLDYVWHVLFVGILVSVTASNMSIFIARQKTGFFNALQLLVPFLTVLFLLSARFIFHSLSFGTYLYSLYFSYGVVFIVSFFALQINKIGQSGFLFKRFVPNLFFMFKYGFYNQLAAVVHLISYRGSFYLIGLSLGVEAIGIYANAVSLTEVVWMIPRSVGFVIYSRLINTKDSFTYLKLMRRSLFVNFVLLSVCFVLFLMIPGSLYSYVFGKEFYDLKYYILWLFPSSLLFGQYLITANFFSGTRRHYINTFSNVSGAIVLLGSGFFLISSFGLKGAVLATTMGYFTIVLIQNYYLKKQLGLSVFKCSFNFYLFRMFYRFFCLKRWFVGL